MITASCDLVGQRIIAKVGHSTSRRESGDPHFGDGEVAASANSYAKEFHERAGKNTHAQMMQRAADLGWLNSNRSRSTSELFIPIEKIKKSAEVRERKFCYNFY